MHIYHKDFLVAESFRPPYALQSSRNHASVAHSLLLIFEEIAPNWLLCKRLNIAYNCTCFPSLLTKFSSFFWISLDYGMHLLLPQPAFGFRCNIISPLLKNTSELFKLKRTVKLWEMFRRNSLLSRKVTPSDIQAILLDLL